VILLTDRTRTPPADIDTEVNNTRLAGVYLFRSLFTALTSNIASVVDCLPHLNTLGLR
jgi:hypothetical protein